MPVFLIAMRDYSTLSCWQCSAEPHLNEPDGWCGWVCVCGDSIVYSLRSLCVCVCGDSIVYSLRSLCVCVCVCVCGDSIVYSLRSVCVCVVCCVWLLLCVETVVCSLR